MPFTGSHPAAVLPLLRTPLPASALVIGSMAPDLPYFLPIRPDWATHQPTAVIGVDLLLGLLAWAVWHGLLAAPALAAAPGPLRARLVGTAELGLLRRLRTPRRVLLVLVALVVGAGTHVLWDGFTHAGGWGPAHLDRLAASSAGLPGYKWAQYASGLLGGLALVLWARRWWVRTPPAQEGGEPVERWVWPVLVAVAVVVVGGVAALAAPGLPAAVFAGITRGAAAGVAGGVLLAVAWQLRARMTRRPDPADSDRPVDPD